MLCMFFLVQSSSWSKLYLCTDLHGCFSLLRFLLYLSNWSSSIPVKRFSHGWLLLKTERCASFLKANIFSDWVLVAADLMSEFGCFVGFAFCWQTAFMRSYESSGSVWAWVAGRWWGKRFSPVCRWAASSQPPFYPPLSLSCRDALVSGCGQSVVFMLLWPWLQITGWWVEVFLHLWLYFLKAVQYI